MLYSCIINYYCSDLHAVIMMYLLQMNEYNKKERMMDSIIMRYMKIMLYLCIVCCLSMYCYVCLFVILYDVLLPRNIEM